MTEQKHIMSIDQGTTSSRAIIYDKQTNTIGSSRKEFTQNLPESGWVEHTRMKSEIPSNPLSRVLLLSAVLNLTKLQVLELPTNV